MANFLKRNIFLLLVVKFYLVNANWELIFSDEFNNSTLDYTKWRIDDMDYKRCDRQMSGRLNCYTNRSENLRLIEGTIALTAIREKHLNKEYTSLMIKTRDSFIYGKFEIRAAFPKGKMLSPFITMYPVHWNDYFDEIIIAANRQDDSVLNEVLFENKTDPSYKWHFVDNGSNLNDFNTYVMEWTQSDITWKLNGQKTFWYNLTENAHPFNRPFHLVLFLRVGGKLFRNIGDVLSYYDVTQWECSLFIIDYVRVYRWNDSVINETQFVAQNKSSDNICESVMPLIRSVIDKVPSSNNNSLIAYISLFSFFLLIIFLPLVLYLFIRIRKLKQNNRRSVSQKVYYDDSGVYMEIFDHDNHNDYDVPDLEQDKQIDNYDSVTEETPRYYITMTSRV